VISPVVAVRSRAAVKGDAMIVVAMLGVLRYCELAVAR
jgi:hypothetical protein